MLNAELGAEAAAKTAAPSMGLREEEEEAAILVHLTSKNSDGTLNPKP